MKKTLVYRNGCWVSVEDYRGEVAYGLNGEPFNVMDLGPLPEGATLTPPQPPEPTPAELAERARAERDRLMRDAYDPAVMQLLRKRRVLSSASDDVAGIDARLAEWDAYADALEVVPDQPGFPNSIEWPEAPSDSVVSGAEDGGVSCESESEPATSEV